MNITERRPYLMIIARQYVPCTNLDTDMNDNTDYILYYIALYDYAQWIKQCSFVAISIVQVIGW